MRWGRRTKARAAGVINRFEGRAASLRVKATKAGVKSRSLELKAYKSFKKGNVNRAAKLEKKAYKFKKSEVKSLKRLKRTEKNIVKVRKYSNKLSHAGRLGMKWGQNIFTRHKRRVVIKRTNKTTDVKVKKAESRANRAEKKLKAFKEAQLVEKKLIAQQKADLKRQAALQKKQVAVSSDYMKKMQLSNKKMHQMSNSELRAYNERVGLERQYSTIQKQLKDANRSAASKFVGEMLKKQGTDLANQVASHYTKKAVAALLKKAK